MRLFTKHRFWRHDTLGAQESATVLFKVKFDTRDEDESPTLGTGSTDTILGLAYGYEGRKWYRWVSLRYRFSGESDAGLEHGGTGRCAPYQMQVDGLAFPIAPRVSKRN